MPSTDKTENNISLSPTAASLPLSALLSQVLVAFTIEFDNEFERQMPHSTTRHGSTPGVTHAPWLVSLAMWSNCMQFVGEKGVRVGELESLARTKTNLSGMERWGYIVVEPDPADSQPKPPRSDWVIRTTPAGLQAQAIWRPLFGTIENRWDARYGKSEIEQLKESLCAVVRRIDFDLPDCLPILGYGLFSKGEDGELRALGSGINQIGSSLPLPVLLSRVLLAFAIEFEREAAFSLAISANIVRALDEKGVWVRDIPLLTGVSKEAIAVVLDFLRKQGVALAGLDPSGKTKLQIARLTPKGRAVQDEYHTLIGAIENRWQERFGAAAIRAIREPLERLFGEPTAQRSPLFQCLEPYSDGWRASVPKPNTLPHYPMVLHRGGFPDGS
jgi:hypothetical protein